MPDVSACIVSYGEDPGALEASLRSLAAQEVAPAEVVICDNRPGRELVVPEIDGLRVDVVASGRNAGFGEGVNLAAARAGGEFLLLLNPDAQTDPGCLRELLAAASADPEAAVVGAQVLLPDGEATNAGDNPIHITGLSWSGRYGEPRESGRPRRTVAVSGAACLVRRTDWERLGGFTPGFFLYHDDVDLCWRARLAGRAVVFCPDAVVRHDYAFEKGAYKWRWLERNRLWCVTANMSARALVLLAPLLLATELAVWIFALRSGWGREKLAGYAGLWRSRRELLAARRRIQAARAVPDSRLLCEFEAELRSPLLPLPAPRLFGPALRAYRRAVVALLRLFGA